MNRITRAFALTGAAAAAVLATAGTVHADTPEEAAAIVEQAVDRAAGAPVTLPSGKTLHVRGLDTAGYRADAAHHQAVVTLADGAPAYTDFQTSPATPQVQTQAAGGAVVATGAVLALVLGLVLWFGIKGGKLRWSWAVLCIALGVVLSSTFIGPLVRQLGATGLSAVGSIFGGL
jgi:hypothetical protein